MKRRNWKRVQPTSLSHALELCLAHAREKHNRSVNNVADLMGLSSHWVLYRWVQNAKIPAISIRPFEAACGIDYVTRYLGLSGHKLVIDIPTGRRVSDQDISDLQGSFARSVDLLLKFYDGQAATDDTLAQLGELLEMVAFHKINVERFQQPEFDFEQDASVQ